MSTDTTTTADTLGLSHGTLTLVTISADYFRNDYRAWSNRPPLTDADDDGRTFYAAPSSGDDMVLVVEPRTSDRAIGMWSLGRDEAGVRLEEDHGGWNVPRSVVTPYRPTTTTPDPRPLAVGDRVRISDTHPAGSPWAGAVGTVQTPGYHATVLLDSGQSGGFREEYLTRVEEGPQEATTGPQTADETTGETFTRAELEEAVKEAVARERQEAADALERWKEHANGIAVQYAKDNDLCGNFERCMSDIGLLGREEWDESHKVTRYVTFRVEVEVSPHADTYATRYEAAEFITERYASTVVDYATEVQDDDGDTIWEQ